MVRVVPIVHRAPPPPLDGIFEPEEDDKMEESSSSSISRPAPDGASKLQRRSYLTSIASSSIASSSNSTASAPTNGEPRFSNPKFSLFDYLQELALTESEFVHTLNAEGLQMKVVAGDGNCMFRAVADQVYGDEEMHEQVRACCLDYMEQERDFFSAYVSTDFSAYISEKRKLRCYGDHLELQAMAELYNRPVEVRIPGKKTLRLCEVENDGLVVPLRLSYHNNNHYNSIRDPKDTRVGTGLGLPANQRPITEKALVEAAVEQSLKTDAENQVIESVKLESAQDDVAEDMMMVAAMKDSEFQDESFLDESLDDDALYAQQLEQEYADMENDELEAAIRLSLQESNGGSS